MNNAILYFYGINCLNLEKINNNYYFNNQNNNYVIYQYDRDPKEAIEIYNLGLEMLTSGFKIYEIILTKTNEVLFIYKDKYYALMKVPNIKNRIINYNDVKNFYYVPKTKIKYLDKSNWNTNWSLKIDFIEYQENQIKNKYKVIDNSIYYFIGIWENAISYFNDNYNYSKEKVVAHKRITTDMDLLMFLNPFDFVIDYKERDIGDYLKSYSFTNNYSIENIRSHLIGYDKNSIILIIARMLFPSYYFDIYEEIILGNKNENELEKIIEKKNNVLKVINLIFDIYINYNIPIIYWIKKEIKLT